MHQRLPGPQQDGENEIARREHKVGRSVVAFRGVFWSAVSIFLPAAVNFLVFMVTSRLLTPADFGAVALALTVTMFVAALGPTGFGEAIVQRASLRTDHLDSVFWLCALYGLVAYAVLFAASQQIGDLFGSDVLSFVMPVLGVRILLQMANVVPGSLIIRSLSFHLIALRTFFATLIAAAISVGMVLAGYGLWALVFAQLSEMIVKAIVTFWSAGWRPRGLPRLRALRELSGYGLFACGNQVVSFLGSQADQALVGYVLGVRSVGLYNFARRIYTMVNDLVSGALGTVSHPLFSEVQGDLQKVRRGFLVSSFLSSAIAIPTFVGIALVADRAIPLLFGDQWLEALQPLRLLCALGVISCVGVLQSALIKSRGRADWWFYYQLASSLLNLVLVVAFAHYGITVMLVAIVAKTYLIWPIAVQMTLRLLSMRFADYVGQFAGPVLASGAMSAMVLLTRHYLGETSLVEGLAVDILVGAMTYLAVLFALAPRRMMDIGDIVFRAVKVR